MKEQLSQQDLNEKQNKYTIQEGLLKHPVDTIVNRMKGRIVIPMLLFKFYIEHGLECKKIYRVLQFQGARPFQAYFQKLSNQ